MARYYDSTAARFCSADPIGGKISDPQTWDRYLYARNDPIDLTDPSGQSWFNWFIDAIIGALSIALPEIDPALFSFFGDTAAATTTAGAFETQNFAVTAGIAGQAATTGVSNFTTIAVSAAASASFSTAPLALGAAAAAAAQLNQAQTPQQPQKPSQSQSDIDKCKGKVLKAVNDKFGTNYTSNDIGTGTNAPFQWPANTPGATVNDNILVPSAQQPTPASPGRFPMHWWGYITGVGSTLHIPAGPGGLDSPATLVFSRSQFTAHLDSAFPYNPIGGIWHLFHDVWGLGGHSPCP